MSALHRLTHLGTRSLLGARDFFLMNTVVGSTMFATFAVAQGVLRPLLQDEAAYAALLPAIACSMLAARWVGRRLDHG